MLDSAASTVIGTLLATTPTGLARSTDGGATFVPLFDTPSLALLSWSTNGTVFAIDAASSVYSSTDGGTAWTLQAELKDRPQALFAAADGTVFVATEHTIFRRLPGASDFESFRKLS